MSDIRKLGLKFLNEKLRGMLPCYIKVSKYYPSEESWTKSPVWWFDLPLSKLQEISDKQVYLLCQESNSQSFNCLCVSASYIIKNSIKFEVINKENDKIIRLHLSVRDNDLFCDLRGPWKS